MPLVPLLLLAATAVALVVAVRLSIAARPTTPPGPEERSVTWWRWVSLALSVPASAAAAQAFPDLGLNLVVAPMAMGLTLLVGTVLAELLVRSRRLPGPRTADLRPRRLADHLPATLSRLVGATLVAALVLCTFTWITASADDMGRAGRSYDYSCTADTSGSRGPYPGEFYLTPYAIGVACALLVAALAVTVVLRRPLGGTLDEAQRHRASGVRATLAALGVVLAAPLCGLAFFAAATLFQVDCRPAFHAAMGWFAVGTAFLSAVTLASCLAHLFVSGPRRGGSRA